MAIYAQYTSCIGQPLRIKVGVNVLLTLAGQWISLSVCVLLCLTLCLTKGRVKYNCLFRFIVQSRQYMGVMALHHRRTSF